MNKKQLGQLLIIGGTAIGLLSLLADVLGLGGDPSVIGWKQLLGAGAGLVVLVIGVWLTIKAKDQEA